MQLKLSTKVRSSADVHEVHWFFRIQNYKALGEFIVYYHEEFLNFVFLLICRYHVLHLHAFVFTLRYSAIELLYMKMSDVWQNWHAGSGSSIPLCGSDRELAVN